MRFKEFLFFVILFLFAAFFLNLAIRQNPQIKDKIEASIASVKNEFHSFMLNSAESSSSDVFLSEDNAKK